MKKNKYTEPTDYIPKEIRKKLKIGEFDDEPVKNNKKDEKERSISNEEFRKYLKGE